MFRMKLVAPAIIFLPTLILKCNGATSFVSSRQTLDKLETKGILIAIENCCSYESFFFNENDLILFIDFKPQIDQ